MKSPARRRPMYAGFMFDAQAFLCSSRIACMTPYQIGRLMRRLQAALAVGDMATLGEHPFVGRLLRHPGPRNRISKAVRRRIFDRDGNRCLGCGTFWFLEIDHIRPVVFGGGDEDANLQTLCRNCNKAKGPTAHALRRAKAEA